MMIENSMVVLMVSCWLPVLRQNFCQVMRVCADDRSWAISSAVVGQDDNDDDDDDECRALDQLLVVVVMVIIGRRVQLL